MNELYFEGWGYFKTDETTADKALDKLMEVLAHEGLEFNFEKVQLRNEDAID